MNSTLGNRKALTGRLLLVALLTVLPAAVARGENCSCSSAYCSTSISCPGGCYAICGTSCSSGCAGGSGSGPFRNSPTPPLWDPPPALGISVQEAAPEDVADSLSQQLGLEVAFFSDGPLTLDVRSMPSIELLRALGGHGAVVSFQGEAESSTWSRLDGYATVFTRSATAPRISEVLSYLLQRQVEFFPSDGRPLSIEAKNMPVETLLEVLSAHGELKFSP